MLAGGVRAGAGRILPSVPARSADLGAPDFPARRAAQFQACLALLDTPEYRDEIGRRYRDKQGLQSPFVSWDALSEPLLALALDCVPAAHLKRVFERLLSDVKTNRSGLPDLIRFWPAESAMSWSR